MNFLDSHFHLDLSQNPTNILEEIESRKIFTIAVTNAPSVFNQTFRLTRERKYTRAAIGLHPELVKDRYREIKMFREHLKSTRYVGEVGLDYGRSNPEIKQLQRKIFSEIISECYSAKDKILTIHSRKAEEDTISIIGKKFPGVPILHWYSGPKKVITMALECGAYFSVNLAMTLSKNGQNIISEIPIERLLTESDGPFVNNGNTPSSPLDIAKVVDNIARLRNIDSLELKSIIYSNFKKILKFGADSLRESSIKSRINPLPKVDLLD